MKIEFFREALSIAESRNFQESAYEQYISQASLSRHIRSLEDSLGIELFDRLSHSVRLTPAGEVVMPYFQQMVNLYDDMLSELNDMNNPGRDLVNVGYSNTARITGVMQQIMDIYEEHSDTEIKLISVDDHQIQRMIAQNKLDVGCVSQYEISDNMRLGQIHLMTDRLLALVPPEHPFYPRDVLSVSELRNQHLILYKEHYAVNEMLLSLCQGAGFEADILVYTTNCSDVGRLVDSGFGIGIQGNSTANITTNINPDMRLIPFAESSELHYYMLYHEKNRKKAVRELIARLKEKETR
ncbi:MAG: LysR family transcriptional regulator [Clostridia bacterium]|nr:LysR family transcriptional regulator [Clostridia bacterium]